MLSKIKSRVVQMEEVSRQSPNRPNHARTRVQCSVYSSEGPTVILVVGVNGGKRSMVNWQTTSINLENELKPEVVDTFLPLQEQLTIWAGRIG